MNNPDFIEESKKEREYLTNFFNSTLTNNIFKPTDSNSFEENEGKLFYNNKEYTIEAKIKNKEYLDICIKEGLMITIDKYNHLLSQDNPIYINFFENIVILFYLTTKTNYKISNKVRKRYSKTDDWHYTNDSIYLLNANDAIIYINNKRVNMFELSQYLNKDTERPDITKIMVLNDLKIDNSLQPILSVGGDGSVKWNVF